MAPAKINLGLHVLRKRDDGYHDIESVLYAIGWSDQLTLSPFDSFRFSCSDPTLPTDDSNLCVKAAKALSAYTGKPMPVHLHLEKHIPYGAGLGGGSSDAAHTLKALNAYFDLGVSGGVLHQMAAALGSDVPFFLLDNAAIATGRGEHLVPLVTSQEQTYDLPFELVVVAPEIHVSTAAAYSRVHPSDQDRTDLASLVSSNNLTQWRAHLVNDFEPSVFSQYPEIQRIKEQCYALGAGYAALSGSGSAVFGVFAQKAACQEAINEFEARSLRVWATVK